MKPAETTAILMRPADLAERLLFSFQDDEQGGFFTTAKEHETLIIRGREGADGATPSGNAVAAMLLARLSFHLDRADFREAAIGAIRAYGRHLTRYPRGFAKSLAVVDFLTEGPIELALVGAPDDAAFAAIQGAMRTAYLPNRIIAITHRSEEGLLIRCLPGNRRWLDRRRSMCAGTSRVNSR